MRILLLLFLFFAMSLTKLMAQLRVDFSPDKQGGCSPFSVLFNNTTTGASANAIYKWDLGNSNTSSLKNAAAIYYEEEEYTVTLTVTDGTQTLSQSKKITVYKKPAIDFSANPTNGCSPFLVNFNATGDNNITTWHWDFGDGTIQQNSTNITPHLYNFKQTPTVSLTAVTNTGCTNTITKENFIKVQDPLTAGFNADNTIYCDAPATINFTNTSTGPGVLTYEWDFGDGNTSAQRSPSYIYTKKGTYTVKMVVRSSEGCVQEVVKNAYINVGNFTSDIETPALICLNSNVTFKRISTPIPTQTVWRVDGLQVYSYSQNFIDYSFNTPGNHTIEMINNFGSCQQTVTKQIDVKRVPVLNGFLVDIKGLCGAPVTVDFKDTTAGAVSWAWDFDYYNFNGIDATSSNASYNYNADNWYYTKLTVKNADGCSAEIFKQLQIARPAVGIFLEQGSQDRGCGSVTSKFVVRSTEEIVSYTWDFADGTTSSDQSPTHTFNKRGTYAVKLTYVTKNGCTGIAANTVSVTVLQKPVADFTVQSLMCGNQYVHFNANITGDSYFTAWDFGDNTGIQNNPSHRYNKEGEYTVTLIALNGICNDTITKSAIIKVVSPFPKIGSVINTCDGTRGLVTITDETSKASKWHWDFGDGTVTTYTTYQPSITHTYTKTGNYKIVLTTEGECTLKDSVTAYVLLKNKPVLSFDNTAGCLNMPFNFQVSGLAPNIYILSDNNPRYYVKQWEYESGNPFNGTIYGNYQSWYQNYNGQLVLSETKSDKIRLITTSYFFGCEDTTNFEPIAVKGVRAAFEIVNQNSCYRLPVTFNDLSTTSDGSAIVKWEWDFGDGTIITNTQSGTATHQYRSPGSFYVRLTVTDANGCSSSTPPYTKYVTVGGVSAAFTTSAGNNIQLNTNVTFYNQTSLFNVNNVTYNWEFGNGVTSTNYSPNYTYTVPGTYVVTLIAKAPDVGCNDTIRQTIVVKNFNTGFFFTTAYIGNYNACPPVKANFINISTNYTRLEWDFGDGFTIQNQPNPSHVYQQPGTYVVRLNVYGYNGLTASHTDTVFIGEAQATINADDLEGCINNKVVLNAPLHENAASYIWDFGNGYVVNTSDSFAVHNYEHAGTYSASLIIKDARGCATVTSLQDKIIINPNPVINILPDAAVVCKANGVQLQATGGNSYSWLPEQGLDNAFIASPIAAPAITTTYTVTATDRNGCRGNASSLITVPKPISINAIESIEICEGAKLQLNTTGAISYEWINTTTGLSNTNIANPSVVADKNIKFTVIGFDQYKCYSDTANVNLIVRQLPVVEAGPDLEVVFGSENILKPIVSNDVVKWNWTPIDFLSCTTCPSPVSKPYNSMQYIVTVNNQYGCSARDTILLKANCSDAFIHIPTAFTPNRDGKNDRIGISGSGVSIIRSFRIYNRWGEVLFNKKDFYPNDNNAHWDGMYKGLEAPVGVYVYFVEMECSAGEKFVRKGTITLVR